MTKRTQPPRSTGATAGAARGLALSGNSGIILITVSSDDSSATSGGIQDCGDANGMAVRVISRFRRLAVAGALLCLPALIPTLGAQTLRSGVGGNLRIMGSDMAVLEAQEVRKDIPCTVTPSKPVLGFDLRFHTGYDVTVPLRELAGSENMLTILMRVSPQKNRDEGVYFVQRVRVPLIEEDAKGEATLGGLVDVGEGNYHVDWLMRDRAEHLCSFYWDSEATLPARDRQMEL